MVNEKHNYWDFHQKDSEDKWHTIAHDQFGQIENKTDSGFVEGWNKIGRILTTEIPVPKIPWAAIGKYTAIGATILGIGYGLSQIEGCEEGCSSNHEPTVQEEISNDYGCGKTTIEDNTGDDDGWGGCSRTATENNTLENKVKDNGCGCSPETFKDDDGWGGCSRTATENDKVEEKTTPELSYLCKIKINPNTTKKTIFELDEPTETKGTYLEKVNKDEKASRLVNHKTASNEIAINFGWRSDSFDRGDNQDIANLVDKCKELDNTCYVTITGLASKEGDEQVNMSLAKNRVNNAIDVLEMYAREKNTELNIKKSYTIGPTDMFDSYCTEEEFVTSGNKNVCRRNRAALVSVDVEDDSVLNKYAQLLGDIKLIDSSGSMGKLWNQLDNYDLGTNEVYAFGDNFEKNCEMNINKLNPQGMTPLYDALIKTCQNNPNQTIDILTDGQDNASQHSYQDVIKIAKENGCTINAVTIGEYKDLNKIIQETNGIVTYFEK
jgi:hypothetical protein